MALTTFRFFIFAILTVVLYFVFPKKMRWVILLISSLGFYALTGIKNSIYILFTATTTYFAARWIQNISDKSSAYIKQNKETLSKEERKEFKNRAQNQRKTILIVTMVLNFGVLCSFKYLNFIIKQINVFRIMSGAEELSLLSIIIPLGISFYTFQAMGYLIDVYWEKTKPQTNYLKLLLFTSFFPQITQGPISNYRQLADQLYEGHDFTYKNFSWGAQRFIWGLFKKMAVADIAAVYVSNVFTNYCYYPGITVFIGALCYAVQIYADFSGYMDMVCGLCEVMGITLAENFERPYFSKSVAEYWRRWHITLGDWFKTYVYYAVGFSKMARGIGKKLQGKSESAWARKVAKDVPATIALIVVWFTTGLWHGANWGYIIWGLLNGLFIIATLWLEPFYNWSKHLLHINESTWLWRAFQVLRTFILVVFIKVLPEVGGLKAGLGLWKQIFTDHRIPLTFSGLMPFVDDKINFLMLLIGIVIIFVFSLLQRKRPIREGFNKMPMIIRAAILAAAFILAIEFGARAGGVNGAFLYAQF